MGRVYVEDWGAAYGSPYLVAPEADEPSAKLIEDGDDLQSHAGAAGQGRAALAFVDGVRRAEAWLFTEAAGSGEPIRAVAGTHACGSVVIGGDGRAEFGDVRVDRVVIWGSGHTAPNLTYRDWKWESFSTAEPSPDAPLVELQNRMRRAEGEFAENLSREGYIVIVDGPLSFISMRDAAVAGYVKTHHRALLPPDQHRKVTALEPGHRTSLFSLGDDRYSCYLRLAKRSPDGNPWSGIVRLELPQSAGLPECARTATWLAGDLPRFAGVPHRDPRAPQNLQPIGALETHLRHRMGHPGLATRAVRSAVAIVAEGEPE